MKNYGKVFNEKKENDLEQLVEIKEEKEKALEEALKAQLPTEVSVANCTLLNLRKHPNKDARVLGVLKKGEELEVIKDLGDWLKVTMVTGQSGYVMKKFTEEV